MIFKHVLRLLSILTLVGCSAPTPQFASLESGFGGTGLLPCPQTQAYTPGDSGFGGTGHSEQCGFGGTGVIGTITDFGSIWVNGLKIALAPNTRIDSNLEQPVTLAIGHQVITHTAPDALETDYVQVLYPIAGRIEQLSQQLIQVAGERIHRNAATQGLKQLQPGDYVAINAWPRADGSWLATRIDPNPQRIERVAPPSLDSLHTQRAVVQGTVVQQQGKYVLAPYDLPLSATVAKQIEQGDLALAIAQRVNKHWQITQIQRLHHWKMDWQQMHQPSHSMPATPTQHRQAEPIGQIRKLREAQHTLYEQRHASREMREQMESLHEQRQQTENMREYRGHFEDLSIQREILEEGWRRRNHHDP